MESFPHKQLDWFFSEDIHDDIPYIIALHLATDILCKGISAVHKDNQKQILADGEWVASRGHMVKSLSTHYNILPPWPPNPLLLIIIPFSENKLEFGSARVRGPDGPLAIALARTQGPSLSCNDPCNMLTSVVYAKSTVLIEFSLADVIAGRIMAHMDTLDSLTSNILGFGIGKLFKLDKFPFHIGDVIESFIMDEFDENIDQKKESAESVPDEKFISLSNNWSGPLSDVPEPLQIAATSQLFGGMDDIGGASIFFAQSEALSGD